MSMPDSPSGADSPENADDASAEGPAIGNGEELGVTLHDMAHGGEAVGLLPDGRTIFVAGGIPGETVRVRITKSKKRWARAELIEVSSPSEDRIEAPCAHFSDCGGCQWQHIRLDRQRALKRDIIVGQLQHLGAFEEPPVEETVACGREDGFGYRNHAQFAVNGYGKIAYHRSRSRKLVGIDSCPLLHPLLGEWAEQLPAMEGAFGVELRAAVHSGQRLAMVRDQITEEAFAAAGDVGIPLKRAGYDEITEMVGEDRYQVSSKSFFQVNSDGAATLVELVLELAGSQAAGSAIDLYAGVGLFTVPLARAFAKVYAVESHPAALRDLRKNSKGSEVHIVGTPVEEARDQLPTQADVVVADPPREGLGAETSKWIAGFKAKRIILVSCDPASLARDARALVDHGYSLDRVVPIDLFPQTFHVETVASFTRIEA